jgi:hypothetical protein
MELVIIIPHASDSFIISFPCIIFLEKLHTHVSSCYDIPKLKLYHPDL